MASMGDKSESSPVYQIKVKGNLDERWSDWFDGFTITYPSEDETLLRGRVVDQAALHGILAKIRDLGLSLLSVERIEKSS
jgi:hypothetical protein